MAKMFNKRPARKSIRHLPYQIGQRLPTLSSCDLLDNKQYLDSLESLAKYANLPDEHFVLLYQGVITKFSELVQLIPDGPTQVVGSLFSHALRRATNTVHVFATHFDNIHPRETYALFTATLLKDISRVLTHYKVLLTAGSGKTIGLWHPFEGALTTLHEAPTSYKLLPLSTAYHSIDPAVTPLLARQVLEEPAFLWLSSDLSVFSQWLSLFDDQASGSGRLQQAIRLQKELDDTLLIDWDYIDFEYLDSPETKQGDAFWAWLLEAIDDGHVILNSDHSGIFVTEHGIFINQSAHMFEQFAAAYGSSAAQVFEQFRAMMGISDGTHGALGIEDTLRTPHDHHTSLLAHKNKTLTGITITETGLLALHRAAVSTTTLQTQSDHTKQLGAHLDAFKNSLKNNPNFNKK